jgi:hypothetical protein
MSDSVLIGYLKKLMNKNKSEDDCDYSIYENNDETISNNSENGSKRNSYDSRSSYLSPDKNSENMPFSSRSNLVYTYVCICVNMNLYRYVCLFMDIIYICICIYVYIYTYIYIHIYMYYTYFIAGD